MFHFRTHLLLAMLLIPLPLSAYAQAPPATNLECHRIMLQHADADYILKLMHWNLSAPPPTLPKGVIAVYAMSQQNFLLVQATPEGFNRVREIVKILDVAAREVEPTIKLSLLSVSEKVVSGFPFVTFTGSDIEIASSPLVSRQFGELIQQGHVLMNALPVVETTVFQPKEWIVPGCLVSRSDFQADLSVRFTFQALEGNQNSVSSIVHRGDVLALRTHDKNDQGQIVFIKVEY